MSLLIRSSVGPAVRQLQEDLTTAGFAVDVDGIYGPTTEEAVRSFQTKNDLPADGKAGPNTFAKLADAVAAAAASASTPPADPAATTDTDTTTTPAADTTATTDADTTATTDSDTAAS